MPPPPGCRIPDIRMPDFVTLGTGAGNIRMLPAYARRPVR